MSEKFFRRIIILTSTLQLRLINNANTKHYEEKTQETVTILKMIVDNTFMITITLIIVILPLMLITLAHN